MKQRTLVLAVMGATLVLGGCASNKVSYADPQGVDTTSINFSSTDLQTTTQKMVTSMLSSPAVARITTDGNRPILFFSNIRNETNEHINTSMLSNSVSTQLINSDKFQFTDMTQVQQMKEQMQYQAQSGMVDQKTAVQMGQQVGAQYMLYGSIADMQAANSSQQSQFYLITLSMTDLKTGLITWQDQQQIRKVQQRSRFGW